jgi:hypothetical protein
MTFRLSLFILVFATGKALSQSIDFREQFGGPVAVACIDGLSGDSFDISFSPPTSNYSWFAYWKAIGNTGNEIGSYSNAAQLSTTLILLADVEDTNFELRAYYYTDPGRNNLVYYSRNFELYSNPKIICNAATFNAYPASTYYALCENSTVTLSTRNVVGRTYKWQFYGYDFFETGRDWEDIPNSFSHTVAAANEGSYRVIESGPGCEKTSKSARLKHPPFSDRIYGSFSTWSQALLPSGNPLGFKFCETPTFFFHDNNEPQKDQTYTVSRWQWLNETTNTYETIVEEKLIYSTFHVPKNGTWRLTQVVGACEKMFDPIYVNEIKKPDIISIDGPTTINKKNGAYVGQYMITGNPGDAFAWTPGSATMTDLGGAGTTTGQHVSISFPAPTNYTARYLIKVKPYQDLCFGDEETFNVDIFDVALCDAILPDTRAGQFKMDKVSGTIVFERNDCPNQIQLSCLYGSSSTFSNAVSVSATTYSDDWTNATEISSANPFLNGSKGKWRPKSTYAYSSSLDQKNDKNYNAGVFKFQPFNYSSPQSNNTKWLKASEITKYTPHGEAVEEINALNIPSTAKFGYSGSVPYLVAQNATYNSVMFESFENKVLEENLSFKTNTRATTVSHSGQASLTLSGPFELLPIKSNGKKIQLRFWVKGNKDDITVTLNTGSIESTERIASSVDWQLVEYIIKDVPVSSEMKATISRQGTTAIYLDDIRVQPIDAEMSCYVYDPRTLRLLAVFDDQHFGLYYQYNDEGQLVRKMIETTRGTKTVQEMQYNTSQKPVAP